MVFTNDKKITKIVKNATELSTKKPIAILFAEPIPDVRRKRFAKTSRTTTEKPVTR